MVESRADTDVRARAIEALDTATCSHDEGVYGEACSACRLAALAEAGLVVVRAEDVAKLHKERDEAIAKADSWWKATNDTGHALAEINRERGEFQDRANAAEAAIAVVRALCDRPYNAAYDLASDVLAALSATEETRKDACVRCEGEIGWIDCPTGGWWAHKDHPADGHDAVAATEETRTAKPQHIGGRANAEACPACDTRTLPYPWICPGEPATEETRDE